MEIKTFFFFICMRDYERYMYKLVYSQPQLSPTFSASVSPDAALPLTTHSPGQGAQEHFLFSYFRVPQNDKTGIRLTLTSHSKDILFSNWGISAALNTLQVSVHCAFLQFQVFYPSFPLHIGVYVRRNVCVCVSVRGSAAQTEGTSRGLGVWRAEVRLAGHFGGLGHGLVHVAVGRAVHGAVRVGAAALVLGRVAAAAAALVGVRAGAVSLAGVGPGAVALEGGDAGA